MESLIELQSVTVHSQEHISLDEVSVAFPPNRSTVIMGPMGQSGRPGFRSELNKSVPAAWLRLRTVKVPHTWLEALRRP